MSHRLFKLEYSFVSCVTLLQKFSRIYPIFIGYLFGPKLHLNNGISKEDTFPDLKKVTM